MNWDQIQGRCKQIVGITRVRWGLMLHDEPGIRAGRRFQLLGEAQQCYGQAKSAADRQLALRSDSQRSGTLVVRHLNPLQVARQLGHTDT